MSPVMICLKIKWDALKTPEYQKVNLFLGTCSRRKSNNYAWLETFNSSRFLRHFSVKLHCQPQDVNLECPTPSMSASTFRPASESSIPSAPSDHDYRRAAAQMSSISPNSEITVTCALSRRSGSCQLEEMHNRDSDSENYEKVWIDVWDRLWISMKKFEKVWNEFFGRKL